MSDAPLPQEALEDLARRLEETGEYRLLRKVKPTFERRSRTRDDRIALIVDVETTGLDVNSDDIIEIGLARYVYRDDLLIGALDSYSGLQEPSFPVSEDITHLTGLTNDKLKGSRLNAHVIEEMIAKSDIVVAHHAGFDRQFCERYFISFKSKPWACSATDIDWPSLGVRGAKLEYLLLEYGLFNRSHRALDDVFSLAEILRRPNPTTNLPVFPILLESARATRQRVYVLGAYEARSALKARGYKWNTGDNGGPRAWWIDRAPKYTADEIDYLVNHLLVPLDHIQTMRLTAYNRFQKPAELPVDGQVYNPS